MSLSLLPVHVSSVPGSELSGGHLIHYRIFTTFLWRWLLLSPLFYRCRNEGEQVRKPTGGTWIPV